MDDRLEELWENLLSRDTEQIRTVWGLLTAEEKESVHAHLQRMVSEEGWQDSQRQSAQAALNVLDKRPAP